MWSGGSGIRKGIQWGWSDELALPAPAGPITRTPNLLISKNLRFDSCSFPVAFSIRRVSALSGRLRKINARFNSHTALWCNRISLVSGKEIQLKIGPKKLSLIRIICPFSPSQLLPSLTLQQIQRFTLNSKSSLYINITSHSLSPKQLS
jgi:hypothetical protein